MVVRFYSSTAQATTLTGSITNVSTTIVVAAVTGFPSSTPYTLALDYNTASEELVTVTATSGTTLTVTRGFDGTSATSHNAGAAVRHVSSAFDFATSRDHENATTGVHGLAPGAAIVGTTGAQTLANKTLTLPIINGVTFSGLMAGSLTAGTFTAPTINGATFNNIGPLLGWTTFTPNLQVGATPITGTAPAFNNGRYMKVGRTAHVHMETSGSSGMIIPGGDSSPITWNVPSVLAPRNPGSSSVSMGAGTASVNFILALGIGNAIYTSSQAGFIAWYTTTNGVATAFDGTALKAGYPVSLDLTYECAS